MRGLFLATALLGALTATAGEGAGRAKPTPNPPDPGSTVSELLVVPQAKCLAPRASLSAPVPRIVSTFPANNAVIRPGQLVLRVTFDRPMSCSGFFMERPPLKMPCAPSRQKMVLSFDRRTVRLICATTPNTAYGVAIGDSLLHAFTSLDNRPAAPADLTFSTSDGPPVATIPEALAQDR